MNGSCPIVIRSAFRRVQDSAFGDPPMVPTYGSSAGGTAGSYRTDPARGSKDSGDGNDAAQGSEAVSSRRRASSGMSLSSRLAKARRR